jgi:hypothetical protein
MRLPTAWRARWWIWALPLGFAAVNAVILAVHPGRTGAGFADMEREVERETATLQELTTKEETLRRVLADARSSRIALDQLYRRGLATEAERLTQLLSEFKRLAQRAGLEPTTISYPEQSLAEYGLVRMSLVFAVEGSYAQVRMLINLLERSDLFLVLERVALRNSDASTLGISLQVSTLFVREPDPELGSATPRPARTRRARS